MSTDVNMMCIHLGQSSILLELSIITAQKNQMCVYRSRS